jgi:hypothetical protein
MMDPALAVLDGSFDGRTEPAALIPFQMLKT